MLEIEVEGSGIVDVVVRGELDMHHAPSFRSTVASVLNRGDVTAVELDLTAVEVLDAAGAGTVIVAHRIAINLRVSMRVCAASALATQILTLLGAADLLPGERSANVEWSARRQAAARQAMRR
ncbi:STAS domain-containing protein [Actinoplanes sp. NPDC026623]|uniref:STAS domain-containing protein n=1 Tax=Actinoplanes sp. NPDC026623 TaxID=3155610 RepID=UPI0033E619FB